MNKSKTKNNCRGKQYSPFSEKIIHLRKQNGLRMKDLGKITGISESYISLLEAGERQPSREVVKKLANAFFPEGNEAGLNELLIAAGFTPTNIETIAGNKDLISIYEQVLEANIHDFKTYISLVIALIRAGKYKTAQEKIQKGLQIFSDSVQLQALLASLELAKGNYDSAILIQQAAIEQYKLYSPKVGNRHACSLPNEKQEVPHISSPLMNVGNGRDRSLPNETSLPSPFQSSFPAKGISLSCQRRGQGEVGESEFLSNLLLNLGVIYFMKGSEHLGSKISADNNNDAETSEKEKKEAIKSFHAARDKYKEALEQSQFTELSQCSERSRPFTAKNQTIITINRCI